MALQKTITQNYKLRANPQYPIVAGVDKDNVPQLLRVNPEGFIDLGGVMLPAWETFNVLYAGTTNNVTDVVFKKSGNEVARFSFTYRHGGVADNDDVLTGAFILAP